MRKEKVIVGVVGPTRDIGTIDTDGTITEEARKVGELITQKEQILLTGGLPESGHKVAIKSAAMEGAKISGTAYKPARLISVLPNESRFDIVSDFNDAYKHLIIKTSLGDERNFINGCIPDVVIAIHGGAGTLSEIAFANALRVPLIFLQSDKVDTLGALKEARTLYKDNKNAFDDILQRSYKEFPIFNIEKVSIEINNLIDGDFNDTDSLASSAEEAVKKAIKTTKNQLMCSFNRLPFHQDFLGKFNLYEEKLNELVV